MAPLGKFEEEALAALQRAVTRVLDRKRRLGQYAVFWEDGRVIFDGPDAPAGHEGPAAPSRTGSGEAAPPEAARPESDTKRSHS